ncbi:MAG: type 4a pilus biogenesis protein PilO [Anaerohalosphaeraceae bacterium]|nr:type 4a pilus biogenesis protein PilO [Anaerohalosphaeraceae bacterium]
MLLDKIKNVNWTPKNVLTGALTLIAMFGLYGWLTSPHSAYLMAAEQYEIAAKSLKTNHKILSSKLLRQEKQLADMQQEFNSSLKDLFSAKDAGQYLQSIQTITQQNGCRVDSLRFLPAKKILQTQQEEEINIDQYRTELSFVGGYVNIVKLISALQNRKEKVWIESLNLHLTDSRTGNLTCDLSIVIHTIQVKELNKDVKANN